MTEPLPLDRAQPLHGRDLRHACLVVLARSHVLTLTDLLAHLEAAGFTVSGADPHKELSDRLRYEVRRTSAWRMRQRWILASGPRD